jgi:hypothetical protein
MRQTVPSTQLKPHTVQTSDVCKHACRCIPWALKVSDLEDAVSALRSQVADKVWVIADIRANRWCPILILKVDRMSINVYSQTEWPHHCVIAA